MTMRCFALIVFAACPVSAAPVPKELAKQSDAEFLFGVWLPTTVANGGAAKATARWTFDGKLTLLSEPLGVGPGFVPRAEWVVGIDPEQKPKRISIGDYRGIYEIADGEVRITYCSGTGRPERIGPGPGITYTVLRRADAPDKKAIIPKHAQEAKK